MTSFKDCLVEGVVKGAITPEIGKAVGEAYANAYADAARTLGPDEADRQAGAAVIDALEKAKIEARRRQALNIRARRDFLGDVASQKRRRGYTDVPELGGSGGKPPPGGPPGWSQGGEPPKAGPFKSGVQAAKALVLLMRNKGGLSGKAGPSVEGQSIALKGLFDSTMADVMEKFEARLGLWTRNRATLANMVREAFGENTGDAVAKALADAWAQTAELARQSFNAAGGMIGKLDKWGLPQSHAPDAIQRAGKDAWIKFIAPLLDPAKMVDKLTGAPITLQRLMAPDGVLSQIYDRIVTHGLVDAYPPDHPGAGALALTRGEERFLTFKDADSWMKYQREFGRGDAYAAMMGHLDGMAQDIALMRVLGPNPTAQFRWLKAFAEREAAIEQLHGNAGAMDRARGQVGQAQRMFDAYTGASSTPENRALAQAMGTTRNLLHGTQLASVILTDMPSGPVFGAMARAFTGAKFQDGMAALHGLLLDPEIRSQAKRLGFINAAARDGLVGHTQDSLRLMTVGEKTVDGMNVFARRFPASVMRLQGLTPYFETRKFAFRLQTAGQLADAAEKPLSALANGSVPERIIAAELGARGFTEPDWDRIRSAPQWEPKPGVKFLTPRDIAAHSGMDDALRVGEMVMNLEQYAVPVSGSLWTRAALIRDRPGTWQGEIARSLLMYKTFVVNLHYQYSEELFLRGLQRFPDNPVAARAYQVAGAAAIAGTLTLTGAMTIQLKRLVLGQDPMPMNTPQFWAAALLQGGSLGILGDFLFAQHARTDKGIGVTALGPIAGVASDAWDLTGQEAIDQIQRAQHPGTRAKDQEMNRLNHDLRTYVPYAQLLWLKTAFSRAVVDQLQLAMDPDAKASFAHAAQTAERQSGAGAWWPRGSPLPTRAPDLTTATGTQPPP